jgi:hypothetical protein
MPSFECTGSTRVKVMARRVIRHHPSPPFIRVIWPGLVITVTRRTVAAGALTGGKCARRVLGVGRLGALALGLQRGKSLAKRGGDGLVGVGVQKQARLHLLQGQPL